MGGRSRLLRILASFDLSRPVLKPAELMDELGVSRASIYRDLADLEHAGLLERVADRGYALGSLIVELDRQIRLADPLLNASGTLLRKLADETGGTVLLCRVHGAKVLCIHQEATQAGQTPVSYERGRAMPLYRGATSKIILAHLQDSALAALWERDADEMEAAGLPPTYDGLRDAMQAICNDGYYVTESELDRGLAGFAAPLMDGVRVLGSLSVVTPAQDLTDARRKSVLTRVVTAAATIESRIEEERLKARNKKGRQR